MRGQWTDYDSFNLVDLIEELNSRIEEPHRTDDILHGMMIVGGDYFGLCHEIKTYLIRDDKKHKLEMEHIKELEKKEKRQTVTFIDKRYGCTSMLYNALPSCDHEIVDGDNWSGIKCRKCGGWYYA